jgi:hypothetical protein
MLRKNHDITLQCLYLNLWWDFNRTHACDSGYWNGGKGGNLLRILSFRFWITTERLGLYSNGTVHAPHSTPYAHITMYTNEVRLFPFQVSSLLSGNSMIVVLALPHCLGKCTKRAVVIALDASWVWSIPLLKTCFIVVTSHCFSSVRRWVSGHGKKYTCRKFYSFAITAGPFPGCKAVEAWSSPLACNSIRGQETADIYIHSPIRLHGAVLH